MAAKNTTSPNSSPSSRLKSYRPLLNRTVFALALLGLLTSVHLLIQQSRGFEEGCFGFSEPTSSAFNCDAVTSSAASTLFGVSNSAWGLIFYVTIALLTAAVALDLFGSRARFKAVRIALVAAGFAYSAYLVYYQFFVLSELCALCLVSAGIVALITAALVVDFTGMVPSRSSSKEKEEDRMGVKSKREFSYMGALVALAIVLIGADVAYFSNAGPAEPPEPYIPSTESATADVNRASVAEVNRELPAECRYDVDRGPVDDYDQLVNFYDPSVGDPNSSVIVIEYFDPNCPHCRTLHAVMEEVVATHRDQALFVFKPFFLWQHSVAQSEALYAAAQEGKFFEMLEHQYAIQQPRTGLSEEDLRTIAVDIGMDPDELMQRVESGIYRRTLVDEKRKGVDIGVNSTPTVLINGRFVALESRTPECLRRMIEQAAQS